MLPKKIGGGHKLQTYNEKNGEYDDRNGKEKEEEKKQPSTPQGYNSRDNFKNLTGKVETKKQLQKGDIVKSSGLIVEILDMDKNGRGLGQILEGKIGTRSPTFNNKFLFTTNSTFLKNVEKTYGDDEFQKAFEFYGIDKNTPKEKVVKFFDILQEDTEKAYQFLRDENISFKDRKKMYETAREDRVKNLYLYES